MLRDDSAGRDNARCLYVCGNCQSMAHIAVYEPPQDKTNKIASYSEYPTQYADAQADLSLRWAYLPFVGFVMRWLICKSTN